MNFLLSDELSGMNRTELGLGYDRRNVYIMGYADTENITDPYYHFKLPDGVPVWIRIRVTDRGT